jgi:hypothetical protein
MRQMGVSADAMLVDPYPRLITPICANAVRLLIRARAPMDQPLLVTSSPRQASYVADIGKDGLIESSRRELWFVPYQVVCKLSAVDIAFFASVDRIAG